MTDDLDRLLSSEDPLVPSSGFTARVMDAVRDAEMQAKPATPFPWKWFVAGAVASGVCAGVGAATFVNIATGPASSQFVRLTPHLGIAAAAVLVSVAPVYGSRFLSRN